MDVRFEGFAKVVDEVVDDDVEVEGVEEEEEEEEEVGAARGEVVVRVEVLFLV